MKLKYLCLAHRNPPDQAHLLLAGVLGHLAAVLCSIAQLCLTLWDPNDCSPPGSSVGGISQARILEQVAISSSRDLPNPGIEPVSLKSPALAGRFFATEPPKLLLPSIINRT